RQNNSNTWFEQRGCVHAIALGLLSIQTKLARHHGYLPRLQLVLSGLELFVTVCFAGAAALPDRLLRYRGKTIRHERAGCLRAHADRSTVVDHSAASPQDLYLVWRCAKPSEYR